MKVTKRTLGSMLPVLAVMLGLTMAMAPVAFATNFGSSGTAGVGGTTNGVWLTNNTIWNVARRGMTATYSTGVFQAVEDEYEVTDFSATALTADSCDDAAHDVCVYDADYGDNGLNGWNACWGTTSGAHPNQQCSVAWVRINEFYSPPAKRIACHELGHSVGLRHTMDQASCLKRTADGGNSSDLTAHDRAHINNTY
jgi:Dual-action HEIGH metallo-peptidase